MVIDESTGLPELPEGYFWRVVSIKGTDEVAGVEVHLMKHGTDLRWFKRVPSVKTVDALPLFRSEIRLGTIAGTIREVAGEIYRRCERYFPIHDELNAEIERLAGDYPPKKID